MSDVFTLRLDWREILLPDTPILEIVLRGTLVYFGLFVLLRLFLKRQTGGVAITDLLVVVLIADAAQNAMAGGYESVPDGILLVATILFWALAFDWLGFHFPRLQRLLHPPPLALVRNGRVIKHNMRHELVTMEELMSHLREQGIQDIADVEKAFMEGDGRISVVPRESNGNHQGQQDRRGAQ